MKIFQIIILLTSLFSLTSTWAMKEDVQVNITSTEKLYQELLTPIWQQVPYEYQWLNRQLSQSKDKTISFELLNGTLSLAPLGTPLVIPTPYAPNKILLRWQLQQMIVNSRIKVTFKFKKFGIKITHSEIFDIKARGIDNAKSKIALNYHNDTFTFKLLANEDFKFKRVDVTPQDGIGEVLKWIFEHIYSEGEVRNYLTAEVNKELSKWANNQNLIKDLEDSINEELARIEELRVKISEVASNLMLRFQDFNFDPQKMNVRFIVSFDNSDQVVHQCAQDIFSHSKASGNISVSNNLVENILRNYTIYEIYEGDTLTEPLFCFGYKQYDTDGNPMGNEEAIKIMGREARFKYWVTPQNIPQLEYNVENDTITAHMKVKLVIKGQGIPEIRVKGEALYADVKGVFKVDNIPKKGISLIFQSFDISNIEGRLKVKLFKLSPAIPLPKNKIQSKLVKFITEELENNHKIITLIDEKLTLTGNINLKTTAHDLVKGGHTIHFDIIH